MKDNERHIEINSKNFTYSGVMTSNELERIGEKYKIFADDVTIGGLVMLGWDEVGMLWAATSKHETNLMWVD